MHRYRSLLLFMGLCVVAGTAWSGKTPPADTTRPGPITSLTAQQTIRALTLRFTATGDDGTTGTVAGYDVRVQPLTTDCAGDPSTWPVASHTATVRNHGLMAAAGTTDFANVRQLDPDTAYCLAIRAFDEVPNYSATWAVTSQSTLAGDWSVADLPVPTSGTMPTAQAQTVVLDEVSGSDVEPALLVSWLNASLNTAVTPNVWVYGSIGFARISAPSSDVVVPSCANNSTECYEQIQLTNPLLSTYIDTLLGAGSGIYVAAIPGPNAVAGLLVHGTKKVGQTAQPRTLVLERNASGAWSSQLVPNVEIAAGTSTNLAYVPGVLNPAALPAGVWDPVFTWVRIDSVTSTRRTETLMLAERKSGVWSSSALFSRQLRSSTPITADNWFPGFKERRLLVKANGTLGLYVPPVGTINGVSMNLDGIYAERLIDGSWSYYDTGPEFKANYGVAPAYTEGFDVSGRLLIAAAPFLSTEIDVIRQSDFAGPFNGLPVTNPAPVPSVWTPVYTLAVPDFPSTAALLGIHSDACGTIQIPTLLTGTAGRTYEVRIVSVHPDATVEVTSGDRIDGGAMNLGAVGMPNGDTAMTYVWGRAPDFTLITRAHNGSCP